MTDAITDDERRTLRFELVHFVCEGQYRSGLVCILESYLGHQGQPEQPAAWISGFFGSGKSHLAKMLRFLWTDFKFPDDGATARAWRGRPTTCSTCSPKSRPSDGAVTGYMPRRARSAPARETASGSLCSASCSVGGSAPELPDVAVLSLAQAERHL